MLTKACDWHWEVVAVAVAGRGAFGECLLEAAEGKEPVGRYRV